VILAQLTHFASHTAANLAFIFDEEQAVNFSPWGCGPHGSAGAHYRLHSLRRVDLVAGRNDRPLPVLLCRTQAVARVCAKVAGALKDSKLEEAIKIADRNKKSHLAEVVTAGLQEFRSSGGAPTEDTIASSGRALERAEAIVHAKLKRGLAVLATIGATAPFVGLLGTVIGILNAFQQIATQKTSASARLPAASRKHWSPPPPACSWPSRPLWPSTISPDVSKLSTWRWTTPPAN